MSEHDLLQSLQTLRGRISLMHAEGHRHFAFFASRAEEGTTTVALQLANLLAQQPNLKVLLVDANMERPLLNKLLAARPYDGLCELLAEKIDAIHAVQDAGGFDLITCGELTDTPAQLLRDERVKRVFEQLGARFDYVIWDVAPILENPEVASLLRAADACVMVLEAERTRHEVARAAQRATVEAGAELFGVVLNKRRYHIPSFVYRLL